MSTGEQESTLLLYMNEMTQENDKRLNCVVIEIAGDQCFDCVDDYHLVLLITRIYIS